MGIIRLVFEIMEGLIGGLFEGFFDFIKSLISSERKTAYDADFSSGEMLSTTNKGFCVTGKKCVSISDATKNVLVIGSTGNYKSSGILIPSILKMAGASSFVVNDPSGELLQKTSGFLIQEGYAIKVINYCTPSEGYNPLLRAKTVSDIQKISKMVVINALGTGSKDPFWNMSAENLISLLSKYLITHTAKEYHTLNNVYYLLSTLAYAPDKVDKLIVATNDFALVAEYKAFISYGDKMLSSIIATCRAALQLFGTDPTVALTTSCDTIDIAEFRKQKICLFINTSTKDMRYYSLITSLFLEQFFGAIMSHLPAPGELPVFFLIDEASSLYFNSLQVTVSNIRKYNAGILQIYQSAAQIVDLYGQSVARAITENSYARVYMAGQPIHVAQELETTLGKFEFVDDKEIKHTRSLMTASEIRESKSSIILCGNSRAIKTEVVPYFLQPKLKRLTELPPYQPANKLLYSLPPLIQV